MRYTIKAIGYIIHTFETQVTFLFSGLKVEFNQELVRIRTAFAFVYPGNI